jgi:Glycosyl transferases group 1
MQSIRVLTWHVHGNYLYYLSQAGVEIYLPVAPGRPGCGGRGRSFPFGPNVHEVPLEQLPDLEIDCVLYQHRRNWESDRHEQLTAQQRRLPQIYLEHDTPQEHPTNTRHWVDDANVLLVHVTAFNDLMWDCGRTPTRVIDHGVMIPPGVRYEGQLDRGIVIVNHLERRGRRLGADVFQRVREEVPLDLVGMESESLGGLGEVAPPELPAFASRYRFYFHPVRYTSLGLALLEAMLVGLPVVGLATTELVTIVANGESGFIETNVSRLIEPMQRLLADPAEARRIGAAGRRLVAERFDIRRFARDWERAFAEVTGRIAMGSQRRAASARRPVAVEGAV